MARTPTEQSNLDHVMAMYRDVLIAMDADKVDQYLSPNYIQHSSLAEPGLAALKRWLGRDRHLPLSRWSDRRALGCDSGGSGQSDQPERYVLTN